MLAIAGILLMIPLKFGLLVPEFAENQSAPLRVLNAAKKAGMRTELEFHRDQRIKKHFTHAAHSFYGFAKRTPGYQSLKIKFRGREIKGTTFSGSKRTGDYETSYGVIRLAPDANLDLVKTGRTRREILQGATITVSGSGNTIKGTLRMKVPIPGGTGRQMDFAAKLRLLSSEKGRRKLATANTKAKQETQRRTIGEIEIIAPSEAQESANRLADGVAKTLNSRRTVRKR